MFPGWPMFTICLLIALLGAPPPADAQDRPQIPAQVYEQLDYLFSLIESGQDLKSGQLSALVDFVGAAEPGTSIELSEKSGSQGAFHSFAIDSTFGALLDYVYNPDIPPYVTMPSSLQSHQWATPATAAELRRLSGEAGADEGPLVLRGHEHETITPDTNTGSYYTYAQNRLVALYPGASGPILVSVTIQDQSSEVGRWGCIVGDDHNWDYLYSNQTGLNRTGLGWVNSYMYEAYAVMVYVADTSAGTLRAGSFKWLNAGWSKINMVRAHHILGGIKRFAADLKGILESPRLPKVEEIAAKYAELRDKTEGELRRLVDPYLQRLSTSGDPGTCPSSLLGSVASGRYLEQMSSEEIIRILLLNYLKERIG